MGEFKVQAIMYSVGEQPESVLQKKLKGRLIWAAAFEDQKAALKDLEITIGLIAATFTGPAGPVVFISNAMPNWQDMWVDDVPDMYMCDEMRQAAQRMIDSGQNLSVTISKRA